MNLIEQLGGYERAKNHRDYLIDFGNEFNRPNKYEVNKINNALLEYRRQHNIFEEGDKVIYLILGNDVITYDDWLKTQNSNLIRHATPEEIAAGKRLEVNQ
ncbi:hypothetical protein [Acinetobacter indicus]|uniref:hypothetical protein n=1 Tax=Acinetobacter indicus TaxID=756892 RepID=UPI0032B44833